MERRGEQDDEEKMRDREQTGSEITVIKTNQRVTTINIKLTIQPLCIKRIEIDGWLVC